MAILVHTKPKRPHSSIILKLLLVFSLPLNTNSLLNSSHQSADKIPLTPSVSLVGHPPVSMAATSASATNIGDIGPLRVGFLGFGTIATSIAKGLLSQTLLDIESVAVSRRSRKNSEEILELYPNKVTVHDDLQEIVDAADIIFLCVLPEQASQVTEELNFSTERHTLISLVSTSTLTQLIDDSKLPATSVSRMICLPAVAQHEGLCLVTPKRKVDNGETSVVLSILDSLGGYVQADDEMGMSAMMVPSGLMGSMYSILRNNRDWLIKAGIPEDDAAYITTRFYMTMMTDALREVEAHGSKGIEKLIAEQTPGGLNEQGLKNLESLGTMKAYDKVQDAMLARIRGEGDGSIKES